MEELRSRRTLGVKTWPMEEKHRTGKNPNEYYQMEKWDYIEKREKRAKRMTQFGQVECNGNGDWDTLMMG